MVLQKSYRQRLIYAIKYVAAYARIYWAKALNDG